MSRIRIGVIGLGKIARDQHLPAIAANPRFALAATVERSAAPSAINFTSADQLLSSDAKLDAVAITTPPGPRYAIARDCIAAGYHVLLEKPPTASLAEIEDLRQRAAARGVSLFTTWHAQHNAAVARARELLRGKPIGAMKILWHEDVEKWHPGQQWIWRAGGFGVFDPGINAFSIVSKIFPDSLFIRSAALSFRDGCDTPIAAHVMFESAAATGPLECSLDWRRTSGEEWTIHLSTEAGQSIALLDGGARLVVDGRPEETPGLHEYPDIYRRFAELVDSCQSEVDIVPLRLVADCLLVGSRNIVD